MSQTHRLDFHYSVEKKWYLHFLGSYIVLIIALILLWANCLSTIITIIITNHHHHFLLERRPKRRLSKEARRVSKEAGEIPVEDGHSSGEQSTARQTTPSQFLGRLSKLSMRKFITVRRCLTCYRRKWTENYFSSDMQIWGGGGDKYFAVLFSCLHALQRC